MNKKIVNTFLVSMFFVGVLNPKLALSWDKNEEKIQERTENTIQNNNPEMGVQQNLEERVKNFVGQRSAIKEGKVVAIDGEILTVVKDDETYIVTTDFKTKFRRKFWGTSSLDEISVNDLVDVVGKWQNEEKTQIVAVLVRNLSVQKRYGVFFGVVTLENENGFKIKSANREDQVITISDTTKIVDRVMTVISLSDIKVGHRVRVKGIWDNANSTITDVVQIKVFSLPVISDTVSTNDSE